MTSTAFRILAALITISAGITVTACGPGTEPPPEYPPMDEPDPTTETVVERVEEPEPEPPAPVLVVAGEHTAIDGDRPTVRFRAPRNNRLIRRGPVNVRIDVNNWELAAAPGRHVHLIVDNEPYIAIRDVSQPFDLLALVQEKLGHELAPGTHVLRTFTSRSHHESVKDAAAFAVVVFHYQSRTEDFEFDADAPLLTFSRPKGCNIVGGRVLVDFFIHNIDGLAADGHRVRYTLDGVSGDIADWAPHYIENLPVGDHELRLQLIGADGEPVPGMFNDTTRTFSVAAVCEAATPACPDERPQGECSVNRQVCDYTDPRGSCVCADDGRWRCTE